MNPTKTIIVALAIGSSAVLASTASAAVSQKEAAQLGKNLTPFGAIKAGTKDGKVPPYTGGLKKSQIPSSYKPGSGRYPNPFAGSKPLYTVTAQDMSKYSKYLTLGEKAALKAYPHKFLMHVYKSHRTDRYPKWVLKNTVKNATRAHMVGKVAGDGVAGAYGGIPFPIPHGKLAGYQLLWNYYLRWQGVYVKSRWPIWYTDSNGHKNLTGFYWDYVIPYYNPNAHKMHGWAYREMTFRYYAPASLVGTSSLQDFSMNYSKHQKMTWVYNPGTRRVRIAPAYRYDTPVASVGGVYNYDQQDGYGGRPNQYHFKVLGREEKLIPYNDYKMCTLTTSKQMMKGRGGEMFNPNPARWEMHRVWVVQATLKKGKRNVYQKRRFYIDEDSYIMVEADVWDHSGNLVDVGWGYPFLTYGKTPSMQPCFASVNMNQGTYLLAVQLGDPKSYMKVYGHMPDMQKFTPSSLQRSGVR